MVLTLTPDHERKLREWVDVGLLDPAQAAAILEHERTRGEDDQPAAAPEPTRAQRRTPLLGEALGYLGAALVAVAGGILLAEYWDQFRYGARLGLVGVLTLVLLGAGAYLRDAPEPAAGRLGGFTWALAVGAAAWFVALVAGQDGFGWQEERLALAVTGAAAVLAIALWRLRSRWQQHLVAFVAIGAALISLMGQPAVPPDVSFFGLAVAGYSVVWLLLGEAHLLRPVVLATWLGMLGLLVGLRVIPVEPYTGEGLVLAMLVTAVLLAIGVLAERPLLAGFGAAAVFLFVPQAVFHFFGDSIGAPAALLLIGIVLLGAALLVVRTRREPEREVSS